MAEIRGEIRIWGKAVLIHLNLPPPPQSEFVPTSQKFVATLLLTPDYFLDADYDKLIKI